MVRHKAVRGNIYYVKGLPLRLRSSLKRIITSLEADRPGIMEAANLVVYFRDYSTEDLLDVINLLFSGRLSPTRKTIIPVLRKSWDSFLVAIPTWFYRNELSNLFSLHIANYVQYLI